MDIFKIINSFILIAAVVIFAWLLNTYIKNQAIDGCARNSSYSVNLPSQDAKVTYPVTEAYKQCLKDKGIK